MALYAHQLISYKSLKAKQKHVFITNIKRNLIANYVMPESDICYCFNIFIYSKNII